MQRRAFIGRTAAATAGLMTGDVFLHTARVAAAQCAQRPSGVQLFTIRDALQRDPAAAFRALRTSGLQEVEMFGLTGAAGEPQLFGMSLADLKALLAREELRAPLAHIDGTLTDTNVVGERARQLGIGTLVIALPTEFTDTRDGRFTMVGAQSIEQLDRLAERLNRAGREYRAQDLGFAYHNHDVEFIRVGNVVPFDYLMANTDPALVKMELDLGWLAVAGVDIVDYLARHGRRVIACHMKDFKRAAGATDREAIQAQLVEPGAGSIDFPRVLEAMDASGVAHAFIEIDVAADPLAAVQRGHRYLETLRSC